MGDRRKCRTYTASPAEPGGLPVMLEIVRYHRLRITAEVRKLPLCRAMVLRA
jgi:hypothetical protein